MNAAASGALQVPSPDWREQIVYFVMIDRFNDGNPGNNDQGQSEFDPTQGSHYSGGDLPGLSEKIPYIKELGATAVWITPPVANQWWSRSSRYGGYHGYWAENLMAVDRHYGTLADLQALSRGLHGKGLFLIQDIVVNHMGNYFRYDPVQRQASDPAAGYRPEPGTAQGGAPGQFPFSQNDARDPKQAAAGIYHWTPDIRDYADPEQEHNWQMAGLDDLNTENPRVREALRRSYGYWIREAGVDAFRVDTAFYVPPEFFRDFLYSDDPAQPGVMRVAESTGRRAFHVFGEGFAVDKPFESRQSAKIERYVRTPDGRPLLPGMLNFPLYGTGLDVFAKGHATAEMRHRIDSMMRVHADPHRMPSFVDNHDVDRFLAGGSIAALKQNLLLIMTLPGIPVIYYGTEQGFTGARAAMFKAGFESGGRDHFDTDAPLYRSIQAMSALRRGHQVFSHGTPTVLQDNAAGAGVLAYRMQDGESSALVLFNTAETEVLLDNLETGLPAGAGFDVAYSLQPMPTTLHAGPGGRLSMRLPARSGLVLLPNGRRVPVPTAPELTIDALPALFNGDLLAVSGSARGVPAPQLLLDGDLTQPFAVQPQADGRWRAQLPTGTLMDPGIEHRLTLWDPASGSASAARHFRAGKTWQPVLTAADPSGDDRGRSGKLRYPTDAGWSARQGDIEQVTVFRAGNALRIDVRLRDLGGSWNPPNGFDHVALTAFLEMPGRAGGSRIMPLQDAQLPDGMRWHYRLRTHGWSNAWFGAAGADATHEGTPLSPGAQITADPATRTLRFTLSAKALGDPASLSGLRLYLNSWDYDGGYRALSPEGGSMAFGGGDAGTPKLLDETAVLVIP